MMKLRIMQIILISICLLYITGCATYHVEPSSVGTEKAVSRIDALLKSNIKHWDKGPKDKAGADPKFFYYGQIVSRDKAKGVMLKRRYSEIEDVSVTFNPGGLMLWGIMDPTAFCTVNLTFKDYTRTYFWRDGFGRFFPFYLFPPNWVKVHRAAKAFEELKVRQTSD